MKVVIILSTMRAPEDVIKNTVSTLLNKVPDAKIIISMNDVSGKTYWEKASQCTEKWGAQVQILVTTGDNGYWGNDRITVIHTKYGERSALVYLHGYHIAMPADIMVEMDLGGSMDPNQVEIFIEGLRDHEAVLSTRRARDGGNMVNTPPQRRLLSFLGSCLSTLFLRLEQPANDMTSGYEAFRADLITNVFLKVPPQEWLCVKLNAAHLFQTEMRAYVLWLTKSVKWVPITFGAQKQGKPITDCRYLIRNLMGFLRLIGRKSLFMRK